MSLESSTQQDNSKDSIVAVQWLSCFWLLWPHGLQHTRLPSPSLSPIVCSHSCPLNRWYHPTISSSVIPFSIGLQSSLASWSFPMTWPFASGGQSIEASASTSVLPSTIQDWFPLGLIGLIFCPMDSQESSPAPQFESTGSLVLCLLYSLTLTSIMWATALLFASWRAWSKLLSHLALPFPHV